MDSVFLNKIDRRSHYHSNTFHTFHKLWREYKGLEPMEHRKYIRALADIMTTIMQALIDHPIDFVAPYRSGRYYIEAVKISAKRKFMDWEKYNSTKKFHRRLIPLTKGYTYRMRWGKSREDRYTGNMKYYKYRPSEHSVRGIKRLFVTIYKLQNDPYKRDFERM